MQISEADSQVGNTMEKGGKEDERAETSKDSLTEDYRFMFIANN